METFVLRHSAVNGVKVIIASSIFIGIGVAGEIFVSGPVRVLGLGLILLGLYILYSFFFKKSIILIANNAGIIPVYLVGKDMTIVPWSNIKRFGTATKEIPNVVWGGNVTMPVLAVYFNQPQVLAKGAQARLLEVDAKYFQNRISDEGTADLYVPATFSTPVEEVIKKLEDMRRKSNNPAE